MKEERIEITCDGVKISGLLHLSGQERSPCVVISHGLFSDKNTVKFQEMAGEFPREGFAALRFDFMGCGESGGRIEDTTISGRLATLNAMFDFACSHPSIDRERIGLMGSSMGGYLSLFKGAADTRVKAIVIWATPHTLDDLKDKRSAGNEPELGPAFYREIEEYRLDPVLDNVHRCLVIHGDADELVPVSHAREISRRLPEPKGIEVVAGADHRFSDGRHRLHARTLTLNWLKRFL
jgi:dienelactone hydrolase